MAHWRSKATHDMSRLPLFWIVIGLAIFSGSLVVGF
jgi:hypothetical protein